MGILVALIVAGSPGGAIAGLFSSNDLPQCQDREVAVKVDEAMTNWLYRTGVDWEGSGYQKQMQPVLNQLKEKSLERSAEAQVKHVISQQLSNKLAATDPTELEMRFCDATVGGIWVQLMLIQNPHDYDDWGLAVQTNIRNLKLVPAPGLATLIFID